MGSGLGVEGKVLVKVKEAGNLHFVCENVL